MARSDAPWVWALPRHRPVNHHIALLIGLGNIATRIRLTQAGVPCRPSRGRCPWNRRRYTGTADDDRARNLADTASH